MAAPTALHFIRCRPELIPLLELLYRNDQGLPFGDIQKILNWQRQELISSLFRLREYGVVENVPAKKTSAPARWCIKAAYYLSIRSVLAPCEGCGVNMNAVKAGV